VSAMTTTQIVPVDDPNRHYGAKVAAVEPGGVEPIPLDERHGSPLQLFWTWASPNLEFATVFVGVIGVLFFGLSFWMAVLAIVIGTAGGAISQGALSTWGPKQGLPQMVLGRTAFGFVGNLLPAGLMSVTAGIGWFAVNSVSGALALNVLTHMSKGLSLVVIVVVQIVVAFFGHNLVQVFERFAFPVLAVIFVIASVEVFTKANPGAPAGGGLPTIGAFLIEVGAAFGYAAGWNPYASDYSRYLKPDVNPRSVAVFAGAGIFVSCVFLEVVGAASATAVAKATGNPTADFTSLMPTWIKDLTLVAIAVGAVAANVLNIYSGAMSFLAMGFRLPLAMRRAIVALVFGAVGLLVAWGGLKDSGTKYESFLLVIAYWIGPWLGVVFVDRWLRRGTSIEDVIADADHRGSAEQVGAIAMVVGVVASIWLFANQTKFTGIVPKHHPSWGDITFEVGFVLSGILYYLLFKLSRTRAERT
jgi:NCS1 nucleoside transporter family